MTQHTIQPKLTLLGAGPGDPELITLKGLRVLAKADVVLYDALVDPSLLEFAPRSAEKVFVGKRVGVHSFSQEEINRLIVEYAFSHGHVVRLKGGDPFVFGRGHEELTHAEAFGIPVEIVPGISSAFSVPALQQIPLTKRGSSESFWVVTGTTRSGQLSNDLHLAAQSTATVVILMGTKKLTEIVRAFSRAGKSDLPIAIIQNGSMSNERYGIGTISTIGQIAKEQELGAPAIIIAGEVVREHPDFQQYIHQIKKQLSA